MKNNLAKKLTIIAFNLCLILITIFTVFIPIGKSESFYMNSYEKYDTYEITGYNESQLRLITNTIIDYLFNGKENMQVSFDGEIVFTNQALYHMEDVKELIILIQQIAFIIFIILIVLGIYIYAKRHDFKKIIFKYSAYTILAFTSIVVIIGVFAILNFRMAFYIFHLIIFPDEQKFNDSFFGYTSNYPELEGVDNRTLVRILSEGLFVDAAIIIISMTYLVLALWLAFTYYLKTKKIKLS